MTTTTERVPFLVTEVTIAAVEQLSPAFRRIELAGADLVDFGVDGPLYDQRIKLIFPTAAGLLPPIAELRSEGLESWFNLPEAERGAMRTYTVRAVRESDSGPRLVVDFALHAGDDLGPGSLFAARAQRGDRLVLLGPRRGTPFGGIEFTGAEADRLLLVADETAVPAVGGILRDLPPGVRGDAVLEVPDEADILDLAAPPGVRVHWCPRGTAERGEDVFACVQRLIGAQGSVAAALPPAEGEVDPDLWETPSYSSSGVEIISVEPATELYAWIAGESGVVTRMRRYLVKDVGLARSQVAFMGYWRVGVAMRG